MKTVIANWKMNLRRTEATRLAGEFCEFPKFGSVELWLAPNFLLLGELVKQVEGTEIQIGGQNCHWSEQGAFTGEISPLMLIEAGCSFVLVGHSERRNIFHETIAEAANRAKTALQAGLKVVFCVGETIEQRRSGKAQQIIDEQLHPLLTGGLSDELRERLLIAYEPVWAIGTGEVADCKQIDEIHRSIHRSIERQLGNRCPVLYGGSVSAENAREIFSLPSVSGALVGGASLDAEKMKTILQAADNSCRVSQ